MFGQKIKQSVSIVLICVLLLTGCGQSLRGAENGSLTNAATPSSMPEQILDVEDLPEANQLEFTSLSDESLHRYLEDDVYAELVELLDSEEYFVENVSTRYLSKEYIETLEYNSKENVYFGLTLSELEACFGETKYVFTLGDDGQTTVVPFEEYDDTFDKVIKNVAVGSGVILFCVTVSVVSGGAGAPAISMIFAASAKTGAAMALSDGVISGVTAGIMTGLETKDFSEAIKAAALTGSEGFKWGAITGAVVGGTSKAVALKGAAKHLTMNEVAKIQKESGYPLDLIKNFKTMDQYEAFREAGLTAEMINGKIALVQKIDMDIVDEHGLTNLQRLKKGLSPLDSKGVPYELHHVTQTSESSLAVMTQEQHRGQGNYSRLHLYDDISDNPSNKPGWSKEKSEFWKELARKYEAGL